MEGYTCPRCGANPILESEDTCWYCGLDLGEEEYLPGCSGFRGCADNTSRR